MISTKVQVAPRLLDVYDRKAEIPASDWADILSDGVTVNGTYLSPEDWWDLASQLEVVIQEVVYGPPEEDEPEDEEEENGED